MSPASMLPFKQSCPYIQLEEPLVLCAIQEMELPTLFPSMKGFQFLMPCPESNWPEETWPSSWLSSSQKEVITLSPLPSLKSSETLKKRFALLPLTTRLPLSNPRTVQPLKRPMNSPTERSSPLEMPDSDAQSISSNPLKWTEKNSIACKTWPTLQSRSAMSTLEETSIRTSFSQEEPPCSKVLEKDSWRKSNREHQNQSLWRLSPAQTEDSQSGEEGPPWHPCQHSPACGSPRKTMTNMEQPLSTESASEDSKCVLYIQIIFEGRN